MEQFAALVTHVENLARVYSARNETNLLKITTVMINTLEQISQLEVQHTARIEELEFEVANLKSSVRHLEDQTNYLESRG